MPITHARTIPNMSALDRLEFEVSPPVSSSWKESSELLPCDDGTPTGGLLEMGTSGGGDALGGGGAGGKLGIDCISPDSISTSVLLAFLRRANSACVAAF